MIHKNPHTASQALAKFSDLLRYQLYDCNEDLITLRQELKYVEGYLELETLRIDSKKIDVQIDINDHYDPDLTIAPFVLIPFIENAFKHVSASRDQKKYISISLAVDDGKATLAVVNSASQTQVISRQAVPNSGVGLKNIQRRLELIYPGKHELSIIHNEDRFQVALSIELYKHRVVQESPLKVE